MLNTQNQGHVNQLLLWQGRSFRLWARKIVSEASLPAALSSATAVTGLQEPEAAGLWKLTHVKQVKRRENLIS